MKKRTPISAAELYVLLDREFRARQPKACPSCYVTLPFRVDRAEATAPNWEIVLPAQCDHGCRELLESLVSRYAEMHDLIPSNGGHDRSLH